MPALIQETGPLVDPDSAIAVVGLDLKFPGDATSPETFFDMLLQGRSALTDIPKDRYNIDSFYHPDPDRAGAINIKKAHLVKDNIAAFDAPFFSITPAEAACMDPQQRGLLESVYRALENAGIPLSKASGTKTSVHIGCFTREYDGVITRDPEIDLKYIATGTGTTMISNRISWFYDFRGASMTLDTACSSSLTACHLACTSLKLKEASMAIVGGCNLFYNPDTCIPLTSLGFLSPDAKCYSFDHRANGYSRGEGFGILVLKRLSDAIRDQDTIRAVIRNTVANQDGRSPGITQPTKHAQVAAIREAYEKAGLDPSVMRYFEAHGTGTPVGDPIEASAIAEVFSELRSEEEPLYVGALKSNIGHLEGAAGIAGLMKAVLTLESGIIPPNTWFEKANPRIPAKWNLKFPVTATPWPSKGLRRASINSFGYGGSNAHVIMDDAYNYLSMHGLIGKHRTSKTPRKELLHGLEVESGHTNGQAVKNETNGFANGDHEETNGVSAMSTNGINGHTNGQAVKNETKGSANGANGHTNGQAVENETNGSANGEHETTNGVNTMSTNGVNGHTNGSSAAHGSNDAIPVSKPRVFVLSAFDESGIERVAKVYHDHLSIKSSKITDEDAYLDDLSYTFANKRNTFTWRTSVVATSLSSLIESLDRPLKPIRSSPNPRLAFIFTGQGAQWYAMGRELLIYSVFQESLHAASEYLQELGCPWSLMEEFLKDETSSSINDPEFSQPICTALQVALVELLASWNIHPQSVVGHSSGEIAAAYAAGAISRASAWRLAYHRGALSSTLARSKQQTQGAMLSVALSPAEAQKYIDRLAPDHTETASIACMNSPKNVTISGGSKIINALTALLDEAGIFARKLQVDNAYHSVYMEPIAAEYRRLVGTIKAGTWTGSDAPIFYSSLTAKRAPIPELRSAEYWVNNLMSPVRFSEALALLLTDSTSKAKKLGRQNTSMPITELVEIGPHGALRGPVREIMDQGSETGSVVYESVLKRGASATDTLLSTAGWLYCRGHNVDVAKIGQAGAERSSPELLIDLPSYPFNHSKSYWNESRLSKGYRFRKFPRHELLGAPVPDWDKSNAIWRNWIRISENPWITDHRITGSILYPAAGMLVMAIEASRQLVNPEKKVKAFRFKEVSLHMALRVPLGAEGVETHFHLRPYADSTSLASGSWSEFELRSVQGDDWIEHCRGLIQTEYETTYNPVDDGLEDRLFNQTCADGVKHAEETCNNEVATKQLYEILQTVGFDFGPTFQNISEVGVDKDRNSIATVSAPDIKGRMPHGHIQPHLIHPTTLDGVLQSVVVAMTKGGRDIGEIMVPVSFKELWIAADSDVNHDRHRVKANASFLGLRQAEASFVSIDPVSRKPLVVAEGFVSTAVAQRQAAQEDGSHRHICFNIDWKPDPSFISQEIATNTFVAVKELQSYNPTKLIADMETLCYLYMKRYMKTDSAAKVKDMKPHHQKYIAWMEHQFERLERGEVIHGKPEWNKYAEDDAYFKDLEARMEFASPEATLTVAVGRSLEQILDGEIDPLQVLFHEKRAENVYRAATGAEISYQRLSGYLDALAHKEPGMKILEVGAGTGGATGPILETLARHGENETGSCRFGSYDFTDISPSFFEKAKETFHYAASRMNFKVLNIESDPVQQGFEPEQYDMIVAANVFHATKSIDKTLQHVRKLLKPGGKLVLYEITNATLMQTGFGFGLLPGWWLSTEPYRKWSPLLSVEGWGTHLQRNDFACIDISFKDYPDARNHVSSVIIATASADLPKARVVPEVLVIVSASSSLQNDVAKGVKRTLLDSGVAKCQIVSLNDIKTMEFDHKICIFLPELESSFLLNVDEEDYSSLKRMTVSASGMFWLTQGGGRSCKNSTAELVTGLARTIRAENATLKFITLSIETIRDADGVIASMMNVFNAVFVKNENNVVDNTFTDIDGVIHIPRIVEANYMNKAILAKTTQPRPQPSTFGEDPSRALKLVVGSPGLLDTLHFDDDSLYEQPMKEGDVEFRVMASGLNFLDIMVTLGQVIGSQIGIEAAGVVTRTGSNSSWKPGDRVCGMLKGSVKTFARTVENALARIPDNVSFTSAASLPVVFVTAYCALYDIADIQKGETVLVHAAAGGVGQASIQLAQLRGAEVYATVGSIEKCELLQKAYGIPRDHIFSSRDLTFAPGIKRMTKGRGVDVIINALSGAALRASWDCMAPFGRFVELGKVDIYSSARLNMENFKNNVRFEFLDVCFMGENDEMRFKRILGAVMRLVAEGAITELRPVQVYPFAKLQEAFRYMQSGAHSGKIVLEPHADDEIMVLPSRKPKYYFDANATYVISGGLGGLGRSMARWLVSRGARNLILLSRSGATRDTAQELVAELEAVGAHVATPPCDVTDPTALKQVLDHCLKTMPPVKGCIQGSMVLKDAVFANMTLEDYYTAIKPKVQASWNLHEVLPKDLDFFILLSSGSGIVGKGGQANYCVGNAYQDALARHRVTNGHKATVLDLGIILSVGYAAEKVDVMGHLRAQGYAALREEEYHALLDELCDPALGVSSILKSQISLGFELPETLRSKGIDFPGWMHDPLFKHLFQIRTRGESVEDTKDMINYGMLLAAAETREAAETIIVKAIVEKLSKALGLEPQSIDPSQPLHAYGVDSLVGVELRTWLLKEIAAEIAVFDIVGETTIRALAQLVLARSSLVHFSVPEE